MRLIPFSKLDIPLYIKWMSDKNFTGEFVEIEDESLIDLQKDFDLTDGWQNSFLRRWLFLNESGKPLGFGHGWRCDKYESHFEIGLILEPSERGKGYGVYFLNLLIETVFQVVEAKRLQLISVCENAAMHKVWQKVGIVQEGRLHEYMTLEGKMRDCYIGSILKKDWTTISNLNVAE